ncbi:hypothetical protein CR513_43766, partial [Mucuna pruriens]
MQKILYASVVGSLMYTKICTRPNIAFVVRVLGRVYKTTNAPHLDTYTCWLEKLSLGNSYNPFNHGCRVCGLLRGIQPWDMAVKLCH